MLVSDLSTQTAVEFVEPGRYRAHVSPEWKLWGPVDGYLAALAMRAAGAHTSMARPASFSCHYLGEAKFDAVDLEVTTLRKTHRAESIKVRMTQEGFGILEALVWTTETGMTGPEGNWTPAPEAPEPEELSELKLDEDAAEMFGDSPFWANLEIRPVRLNPFHLITKEEVRAFRGDDDKFVAKLEPRNRAWERFAPRGAFDDPWVDACRYIIMVDISGYPTVAKPYTPLVFIATTLDLTVTFHVAAPADDWLLIEGNATAVHEGLMACRTSIWSRDRSLAATGSLHMLYRDLAEIDPAAPDRMWRESVVTA